MSWGYEVQAVYVARAGGMEHWNRVHNVSQIFGLQHQGSGIWVGLWPEPGSRVLVQFLLLFKPMDLARYLIMLPCNLFLKQIVKYVVFG